LGDYYTNVVAPKIQEMSVIFNEDDFAIFSFISTYALFLEEMALF
jgi:hypothetical protein